MRTRYPSMIGPAQEITQTLQAMVGSSTKATNHTIQQKDTLVLKEGKQVWLNSKDLSMDRPSLKLEVL